jgi:uncharacterized protein YlxW (UPF0749 family)
LHPRIVEKTGCPGLGVHAQVKNLTAEIARLKEVIRHAEYWEAVRKEERDSALAEAERLRKEMGVHDIPGGGVAGMLTITPEAAKGLMEGDE